MKNLLVTATFIFGMIVTDAQVKIPQLSPTAKIQQQIGLGTATITYGRPSLRGRKLLGQNSIPYGKVWRMGANEVTTLELDENMSIEGKPLAKGKYAFVAIPEANEWTIIINSNEGQWGVYNYNEKKDLLRFKVSSQALLRDLETLTFTFEDILPSSANIVFRWENVQFKVALTHDADAKVMADIKEKTSKSNPSMMDLMESAEYYLMMNRDLEQALKWSTQVLEKAKSPFRYNLQAQIAQKLNKCDIATEAAKEAIKFAERNGDAAAKALAEDIIDKCGGSK
jgi:Protein of unknown function (DUF2911)